MLHFNNHYLAKIFIDGKETYIEDDFSFMFSKGMTIKYVGIYYILREVVVDLTVDNEAVEYYLETKE